jgi:hypothetical protein
MNQREDDMNTIAFDRPGEGWDSPAGPGGHEPLPARRHRKFLNRWSAGLIALLTATAGFYAGVRVEKGQVGSSSTGASALASRFAALRAGASGGGSASAGSGAATGAARSGFAARFGAGGGATVGSISSIKGNTIYLTETSGDVVQVKITSATKVTKSETVKPDALNPGNTLIVQGLKQANGTISATSVSDSGAGGGGFGLGALAGGGGGAGAGAGTGAGAGSSAGSGSAGASVGSLFSSGG